MNSIRRHLTIRLLIGTCVIGAGVLAVVYAYLRHELFEQFDATLVARARTLGSLVRLDDEDGHLEFELTERSAREFRASSRPDYFQIWDHHGRMVARSDSLQGKDLFAYPGNTDIRHRRRLFNLALPDGRAGRAVTLVVVPGLENTQQGDQPARSNVPNAPPVTLMLASDLSEMSETTAHVLGVLLLVFAASAAAMVLTVVGVVRRSLRPLLDIGDAAARVDPDTLSTHFSAGDSPEELRPVVDKLNDLLDRLDSAFKRERRFTSNVAHELRTPIAELRSLAEVAIRWPEDARSAEAGNFQDVLLIARQMQSVVTTLLSMARCQAGQERLSLEQVELAAVITESWRPQAAIAASRGLAVDFELSPAKVETDHTILAAVFDNVLANAVTYTPNGGRIRCRAWISDGKYCVEVLNGNNSLTEQDLPFLTEPFWRKDAARTSSSNSGLGLALVAAYAKLLDINFGIALRAIDLFVVTLKIPLRTVSGAQLKATLPAPATRLPVEPIGA
jgi:signal transduction histidine kinase